MGPDIAGRRGPDIGGVVRDAIRETVETLVNPLREQLEAERAWADRAEKRADEERARADQERDRADRERDRASQAEKLITELRAPPPAAEPPRTGWNRGWTSPG